MKLRVRENLTSSAVSLSLSLVLTPVISRLYGPEAYGVFSVVNGMANALATASLFALPSALVFSPNHFARLRITAAAMKCSIVGMVATFVSTVWYLKMASTNVVNSYLSIAIAAGLLFLLIVINRLAFSWNTVYGRFGRHALARTSYSLLTRPLSALAGAFFPYAITMLFCEIVGFLAQNIALTIGHWRRVTHIVSRRYLLTTSAVKQLRKHHSFSALELPSQLFLIGAAVLPVFVVGIVSGEQWSGWLAIAISLASLPVQMISLAIAPAMLFQIRRASHDLSADALLYIQKAFVLVSVIAAMGYGVLYNVSSWLLPLYLGRDWSISGVIVGWLCLPFALHFLVYPFAPLYREMGLASWRLCVDAVGSLSAWSGLIVAAVTGAPSDAILCWAALLSLHRIAELLLLATALVRVSKKLRVPSPGDGK